MIKKPLVSVSITTYQHSAFIEKAINSVLMQQTNFPFEIIIGEDQSTDGTREICINYAEKYPDKIKLFLRSRENVIYVNGAPTGRFNFIENIRAAKGKYIALLEGDDYWVDTFKLQKQVDFLEKNSDYVLSFHDAIIINENNEKLIESKLTKKYQCDRTPQDNALGKIIPTLTVMFRKELIKEFPSSFYKVKNGDTYLFALIGQHGKAKFHNDIIPAAYRAHTGGIWSNTDQVSRIHTNLYTLKHLVNVIKPEYKRKLKQKIFFKTLELIKLKTKQSESLRLYICNYKYFVMNKAVVYKLIGFHLKK